MVVHLSQGDDDPPDVLLVHERESGHADHLLAHVARDERYALVAVDDATVDEVAGPVLLFARLDEPRAERRIFDHLAKRYDDEVVP